MKKIFGICLGNWSETAFVYDGRRLLDLQSDLPRILERECSPYTTNDADGVLVYMSKQEFESLQAQSPKSGSLENKAE